MVILVSILLSVCYCFQSPHGYVKEQPPFSYNYKHTQNRKPCIFLSTDLFCRALVTLIPQVFSPYANEIQHTKFSWTLFLKRYYHYLVFKSLQRKEQFIFKKYKSNIQSRVVSLFFNSSGWCLIFLQHRHSIKEIWT